MLTPKPFKIHTFPLKVYCLQEYFYFISMDPGRPNSFQNLLDGSDSSNNPYHSQNPFFLPQPEFYPNFYSTSNLAYSPDFYSTEPAPDIPTQSGMGGSSAGATRNRRLADYKKDKNLATMNVATIKRKDWMIEEDKVLISGYLNVSKDSIVGTDQSGVKFWNKIAAYYDENKGNGSGRDYKSCKNRWHAVNGQVSKFVGAFNQARSRKRSGESENDIIFNAHKVYESETGKKFNLAHAWLMLRDDPKWMFIGQEGPSKRTRINVQGHYSSSSEPGTPSTPNTPNTPNMPPDLNTPPTEPDLFEVNIVEEMPTPIRPIGVKAAKRRAKQLGRANPTLSAVELEKAERMDKYISTQTMLAEAMSKNAHAKMAAVYYKLLRTETRSAQEEKFLKHLETTLFPDG